MSTLVFLSQNTPEEEGGGLAVLRRHMVRSLVGGHQVVAASWIGKEVPGCVNLHFPTRQPSWLPVRRYLPFSGFLRAFQEWLWLRSQLARIGLPDLREVSLVLTTDDIKPMLVAVVARFFRLKSIVLLHDIASEFKKGWAGLLHRWLSHHIVKTSYKVAAVSAEVLRHYRVEGSERSELLPPIPAEIASGSWSQESTGSAIATFGTFYTCHGPMLSDLLMALASLHRTLIVIGRDVDGVFPELQRQWNNLDFRPYFQNVPEAMAYLGKESSGFIFFLDTSVPGSDWLACSFPSRLVQAIQFRKPVILLTRGESATRTWAEGVGFVHHVRLASNERLVEAHLSPLLHDPATSTQCMHRLVQTLNPEHIQQTFIRIVTGR